MAYTRADNPINWSAESYITLSAATQADSDAFTFNATDIAASIQIEADNQGTPSGATDYVDVFIKFTCGDIGADDYDSNEYAQRLVRLDTVAANTPGEDPCRATIEIPCSATGFKLSVVAPNAATRNIKVTARCATQRAG